MDTPEKVLTAIYRAVDLINAELPPDRQLSKTPVTRLLGSQSVLDSLHLVSLLINIEREVEDTLGVALTLANERALSMKESPTACKTTFISVPCGHEPNLFALSSFTCVYKTTY